MFNSPILDLVILLSFTYFIGSIMLTAINEAIAAIIKTRARDLKATLESLLIDTAATKTWQPFVQTVLFNSQHILSLMKSQKDTPSYIPAKNFVLAIIEQLNATDYTAGNIDQAIIKAKTALPQSLQDVLNNIWTKVSAHIISPQERVIAFEQELELFYDNAMERATGWYKRKTMLRMIILGFILAVVMNIDTIKITNDALSDKDKLSKTVDNIANAVASIEHRDSVYIFKNKDTVKVIQTIKIDTVLHYDSTNHTVKIDSVIKATITKTKELKTIYNNQGGYQMGYGSQAAFMDQWFYNGDDNLGKFFGFILKLIGVLLTAFAMQLGSNYWFDILNKTINIRAAGKKPGEVKK